MLKSKTAYRGRVLDFDIETRRVGFFSAGKFSPDGCEPIAIAASWVDEDEVHCWTQGEYTLLTLLNEFRRLWDQADIATGHYVLKFDLPILQGSMLEHGLEPLSPKLVSDTKIHLVKKAGIGASQENLSMMYGLEADKFHMSDTRWREASRLTPEGIQLTRKRVTADIIQHKALRQKLIGAQALKPPTVWKP